MLFKAAFGLFQIISKDVITLRSLEDAQMFFEKRIEEFECNDKMVFYLIIKKFDFDMETITRERDKMFPKIVQGIRENGNFDDGKSKPSSSECDVDWPWCVQDVSYRHWIGDVVVYKGMNEVNINEGYLERMNDNVTKKKEYKMKEEMYKDMFNYAKSAIAKNRMKIDGIYSHMMFDATYALTQGRVRNVLGVYNNLFVEAYSADINRKYHKEIAEIENNNELTEEEKDAQLFELLSGVVVKYPSAMPKEYEIVVYLTDRQIRNRLKAMNITNEDRRTLQQYFNNTPYGCTVYAPINAMKNKLAGADCDFDATMTDMSELKQILIAKRRKEGYMGDCVVISYK